MMKEKRIKQILEQIGQKAIPDNTDAWPSIQTRLKEEGKLNGPENSSPTQNSRQIKRALGLIATFAIALIFLLTVPKNQAFAETLRNLFNPSAVRTPQATPTEPANTDGTYTVTEGDTLTGIAAAFGITIDQLVTANPQLDRTGLVVGDTLRLPEVEKCKETTFVTVQPGDTLAMIASRMGVTVQEVIEANPNTDYYLHVAGEVLTIEREIDCTDKAEPMPKGRWAAETEFGSITFTVGSATTGQTRFSQIAYHFDEWTCEDVNLNTYFVDGSGYSLDSQNRFEIENQFFQIGVPPFKLTGFYDPQAQIFSGTWEVFASGTSCAGEWQINLNEKESIPAGRWPAKTEFGSIMFTISHNAITGRARISQIWYQFDNWSCGDQSIDKEFAYEPGPGQDLDEQNMLKIETQFHQLGLPPINIYGNFDFQRQIFYGTWEVYTSQETCTGAWAAALQE